MAQCSIGADAKTVTLGFTLHWASLLEPMLGRLDCRFLQAPGYSLLGGTGLSFSFRNRFRR